MASLRHLKGRWSAKLRRACGHRANGWQKVLAHGHGGKARIMGQFRQIKANQGCLRTVPDADWVKGWAQPEGGQFLLKAAVPLTAFQCRVLKGASTRLLVVRGRV
jgi:hypothetical protein